MCIRDSYVIGQAIIFCPVVSFFLFLSLFLAYSHPLQIGCVPYFYTWCGRSANLECRFEMCYTRLAEIQDAKIAKIWPSVHHRTALSSCIFATKVRIDLEKNFWNSNTCSTCAHNMANFGPLTAEICWRVWGTPANFNEFRVLATLLHGTLVVGVSQTLRRWEEGGIYIRQGGHHVGHWPTF